MKKKFMIMIVLITGVYFSCKRDTNKANKLAGEITQRDTVNVDGDGSLKETNEKNFPELGPDFSPEGSRIAYYSYIDSEWSKSRIYLINTDGTNKRELTTNDTIGFHTEPVWSPDGGRIAYTSFLEEGARMMSIDSDGTNLKQLTTVTENGFHMFSSWDLNGEGYYFFHWTDGEDFKPDAYYTNGDSVTRLTTDGITNRPQLAADGTLFISKIVDLKDNVYSRHILDKKTKKVTDVPELEGWFISGDRVLKQEDHDKGTTFILEDLSGTDLKEVGTVSHKSLMFAKIDPNRQFVAYNTSFDDGAEIYLLNINSGNTIKLTQND
jgi:Tol biopolymer transport system component